MFNLDLAIANWRRQMLDCGFKSLKALEELEDHLRDDIEAQVRSGLNEEQALEQALRRLGTPAELKKEFAKSPRPAAAQHRKFLECFYFICAAAAILIDLWTLIFFDLTLAARVSAGGGVAILAVYLFGLPFWFRWTRGAPHVLLVGAFKVLSVIVPLWVLFALLNALQVLHCETGIVAQLIMWSLCAAYGLTALACRVTFGGSGSPSDGFSPFSPVLGPNPAPPSRAFNPVARQALDLAREEALGLGHNFIGTEHLLLGVLGMGGDELAQILERSQVRGDAVRKEIERLVSPWPVQPEAVSLPLTPRARKALLFAGAEAAARKHPLIRPEHVFLGLLMEGSGVAALALKNLGVELKRMRAEVSAIHAA